MQRKVEWNIGVSELWKCKEDKVRYLPCTLLLTYYRHLDVVQNDFLHDTQGFQQLTIVRKNTR
jgi:hypothetical protein